MSRRERYAAALSAFDRTSRVTDSYTTPATGIYAAVRRWHWIDACRRRQRLGNVGPLWRPGLVTPTERHTAPEELSME